MSRKSIELLGGTPPVLTYTSEPVRVDRWYSSPSHVVTLQVVATNFFGRLIVQASYKNAPQDADWFPVALNGAPYIDYPRAPTCSDLTPGETSTLGFSVVGRYTWMRAIVDRSHVITPIATALQISYYGYIDRILINL